jgi:imidazolonepropionase-like amidohydrolase
MPNYLISNGSVLDCTGAKPKKHTSLFVEGNRIAKIGEAAKVKKFAEGKKYKTIDAAGKAIMLGLSDCHVHPYGDIKSVEELELYAGVEYRTLRAAHGYRKVLCSGMTSICTPGGTFNINVELRDAVNSGLIEGPRISAGSRYLSTYNSIGSFMPSHMEQPPSSFGILCNTTNEFVKAARKVIKDGHDVVKVAGDGDTSNTIAGQALSGSITFEDMRAIVEVTHLKDKKVTGHCRSGRASADAARAGFDWIIHASYMNDEELGVVIDHRTPINPTLSLMANTLEWGPDLGLPPVIIENMKHELDAASKVLGKAYKEGVVMMSGTNSGQVSIPYGAWHAREIERHVHYLGMSNMDAILSAMLNNRISLPFGDEVLTVEESNLADILVVDGDPLADIAVHQDPARLLVIMKDGEIVDTSTPIEDP